MSDVCFTHPVKQMGRVGETKEMGNFIHFLATEEYLAAVCRGALVLNLQLSAA